MSGVRVSLHINGELIFDDDLDSWQLTPPDYFKDALNPNAKPEPWLKAIMIVMADAAMTGQSVSIKATTWPDRWLLEVSKVLELGS